MIDRIERAQIETEVIDGELRSLLGAVVPNVAAMPTRVIVP